MDSVLLVRVTTPDREVADRIAEQLVNRRLCASVHVCGPTDSSYWWNGALHHASEWTCEARTRRECLAVVRAAILELHPYEVPEILESEVRAGTGAYARWLEEYADAELRLSPVIMGT